MTATRRQFATEAEFNDWHEQAKTTLGLPRVGVNAASGMETPGVGDTTAYTSLEIDVNGNPLLTAIVANAGSRTKLQDVATLVRADMLTRDELVELVEAFPPWRDGERVEVGDLRSHAGKLYRCVQAHTTQEGWEPSNVPALWVDTAPAGVIPEWVQPTGAHDAYNAGDRVTFEGSVYESLIDGNVWSPAVLPSGWQLIE